MTYDRDVACWMVHLDGGTYPMHCGECLEVRICQDKGIACTLELDRHDWYVVAKEARFYLRQKDTYQIHI
nr:DUF5348 domain-containing protein [Brevibacillus parabrevis]